MAITVKHKDPGTSLSKIEFLAEDAHELTTEHTHPESEVTDLVADLVAILSTVADHIALTATPHGAVSAATASKIVVRDAAARAAFAAPAAAGDALIKGTAQTITEMPALTTGKIWEGVANRPSEVDMPGADFPQTLKPALVRWVLPGWYAAAGANLQIVADYIFYIPIFVEETTTYIRIGITVTTASPGTADLRIFNWTAGLPSSLILAAGTINTGTTGSKEIVISQTLTRGYYFLAIRCTGTPSLTMLGNASAISAPVAGIALSPTQPRLIILAVIAPYADPAPAPTMALANEFAGVFLREN